MCHGMCMLTSTQNACTQIHTQNKCLKKRIGNPYKSSWGLDISVFLNSVRPMTGHSTVQYSTVQTGAMLNAGFVPRMRHFIQNKTDLKPHPGLLHFFWSMATLQPAGQHKEWRSHLSLGYTRKTMGPWLLMNIDIHNPLSISTTGT